MCLISNVRDTLSQIIFGFCFLILYHKSRIEYLQIVFNRIMLFMDWKRLVVFMCVLGYHLPIFAVVILSLIFCTLLLFRYTCMHDLHYNTVSVVAFYREISGISLVFDQRLPIIRMRKSNNNITMNTNKSKTIFRVRQTNLKKKNVEKGKI